MQSSVLTFSWPVAFKRQVVNGALFAHVGRGKVHRDAADREIEPAVFQCGAHAIARFLYGGVRQADKVKGRQTGGKVTFHFHFERVHAEKSHAECF